MKAFSFFLSMLFITGLTLVSCGDDEPDVCATWDADIKQIIDSTCAYSGCHSGGDTANMFLSPGSNDYTSYAAIKANLDNGRFVQRALVDKTMPNPMFVPDGRPTELTQQQIDLLQCWADAGFPES